MDLSHRDTAMSLDTDITRTVPEYTGITELGSDNAFRGLPGGQARRVSAIDQAFASNEAIDPGSSMPESSNVNIEKRAARSPAHRAGAAAARARFGVKLAAGIGGISSPVAPTTSTTTYKAPKPVQSVDPRTDKPPGQSLTQGVQTMSYGADVGDSYTSFSRRLQGSPV